MKHRLLLPLLILLLAGHAQAQQSDFGIWLEAAAEKNISKKVSASLQEVLRFDDNATHLNNALTYAGIEYEFSKKFKASANYRLSIKGSDIEHRLYADGEYKWKLNDFTVKPRLRIQHDFTEDKVDENYIRPKLTIQYKINKTWEPFVSGELLYHVLYYKGSQFDESRWKAGTSINLNKHQSIDAYFMLKKEFNVNNPENNYIGGLGYKFGW